MKQFEITGKGNLLDQKGHMNQAGYAKDLVLTYDRKMIKASKWRIKEWDYYLIGNKEFAVSLTVADNSYMGLAGAQFFDFKHQKKYDFSKIIPLPAGRLNLPTHSKIGDISYQNQKISISIQSHETHKELYCKIPNFADDRTFELNAKLFYRNRDSMVIATPFVENEKAFYYNQKVNNLEAAGMLTIGDQHYNLDNIMGVLDWGRGVWTYDNTWYWSSASTILEDGSLFGFNLGYGFGDTSKATENMVFYQGKAYKLNDVDFGIPSSSYLSVWHFTSSDKSIDLKFEPIYDNGTNLNLGVLKQDAHQVFGLFSGYIEIEQKKKIEVNQVFGFAEKVHFKW